MEKKRLVPGEFPVVKLNANVMPLPGIGIMFSMGPSYYSPLIQDARAGKVPYVFAVMQKPGHDAYPDSEEGLYEIGVVCSVEEVDKDHPHITFFGRYRAKAGRYVKKDNGLWTTVVTEQINDKIVSAEREVFEKRGDMVISPKGEKIIAGLLFNIKVQLERLCQKCIEYMGPDNPDVQTLKGLYDRFCNSDLDKYDTINELLWGIEFVAPVINTLTKQLFIEEVSFLGRIGRCMRLLEHNINVISEACEYDEEVKSRTPKDQKKRIDKTASNIPKEKKNNRQEKFQKIKDSISIEAQRAISEDFNHLDNIYPGSPEGGMLVNHLDCLLSIYSTEITPQENDISKVEMVLGQSHYGLEDIKERIYDYLATKIRNPRGKAPILCFVGPPGVGKTSIGKSVAESLGLKFVRLSLGGVMDEAEIRGHRQTYMGAMPGKIIQEIIRTGVRNPVFMLDEVDKINSDFRGDPSSALLEVLDPEQNHSFQDHYVGAPFDLSGVLFLCTANTKHGIQPALRDRMETLDISGYTEFEKVRIATKFLIPKQLVETGFPGIRVEWQNDDPEAVISKVVKGYTREAGVRGLERQLHQIFERWGRQVEKNGDSKPTKILITEELIEKLLGLPKHAHERVRETKIGEAIGLVVNNIGGGDTTYVQAQLYLRSKGEKSISQTDTLGDENDYLLNSNKRALTVVKNLLEDNGQQVIAKLKTHALNLQVSDDAAIVDGPSAGITMAVAIYSELTGKVIKPYVAMTGLITIKGMIKAVGGIKEKVLAAHRDGIKEIILPASNERDVIDKIPEEVKKDLNFHFVSYIEEVLPIVFPDSATSTV